VDVAKFRGLTSKSIGDVSGNVDLPSKQSGLNQFLVGKLAGRNRISPTNLGNSSRKLLSEQKKYRDVRYAQTYTHIHRPKNCLMLTKHWWFAAA